MKIFQVVAGFLFVSGVGMNPAHGYPLNGTARSEHWGFAKERIVLAQAKTNPAEKESDKYIKEAQQMINEYKGKIKELEAKAKTLNEKAKAEVREGMDELQKKMDVAEQKLKSIRSAGGEAWQKLKAEADSSLESVKEAYKKIADRFQ
jgi:hypothetical protein